ncbi:MAG: hypothetical protein GX086_02455, partial [Alcaligenaceae bacterium]|nr:hypothetical protein [Alcaligenaceae bacterium]
MTPQNENNAIRGLHVVLPGKTLAWFSIVGLLDVVWSEHYLNAPALFSSGALVALLLCGLALVALLRLPVISPWLSLAAFAVALTQGVVQSQWPLLPLSVAVGVFIAALVQRFKMRYRWLGWLAALSCLAVAVACVLGLPGLRDADLFAPGLRTHIDAILAVLGGYAIFMASLRPLAPPVNNKWLVLITVLGSLLAAIAWFVLAEQDRQFHLGYLDPSGFSMSTPALLIPLNQWLPDLIFSVCFAFTWMMTRTTRLSVV